MDVRNKVHSLWTEKYRPSEIEDLVAQSDLISFVNDCIKKKDIPHLLLYGKAGTGKGSITNVLLNNIPNDNIVIDCSTDTGINTIREKVLMFAKAGQIDKTKLKIVVLNETDGLSSVAQKSLKNTIEEFSMKTRFILMTNHINKIIKEIRSRCVEIKVDNAPKEVILKKLLKICEIESIKIKKEELVKLINKTYPDIRKMLSMMQNGLKEEVADNSYFKLFDEIFKNKSVKKIAELLKTIDIDETIYTQLSNYFIEYNKPNCILIVAEFMYKHAFVFDAELNLMACLLELKDNI